MPQVLPKFCLLVIFSLAFANGFSQDLSEAMKSYFLDQHFTHDWQVISGNKIKSLQKIVYYMGPDSLGEGQVKEYSWFNREGMPVCLGCTSLTDTTSAATYFTYDSLGRPIEKAIVKPKSPYAYPNRTDSSDPCGNRLPYPKNDFSTYLADIFSFGECLPTSLKWIERGRIDSIIESENEIRFLLPASPVSSIYEYPSNAPNQVIIYPKKKELVVESHSQSVWHNHRGTFVDQIRSIRHYNENLVLVLSEEYIQAEVDETYEPRSTGRRYRRSEYAYYDNGLLKSIEISRKNQKLIQKTEVKLDFYE